MFRRMDADRLNQLNPRRICVIKPSALGDIVQSLPILPVLRQCYPDAAISWVINKGFANLLAGHPLLDELLIFDRRGTWSSWGRLLRQLRARKFDLVFDLQGLLRTGVMTWATRAPVRVGLETAREGSRWTTNCILPGTSRQIPAHARNWRVAELLGRGDAPRELTLNWEASDLEWCRDQFSNWSDRPVLAIAPGAQWVTKRWPAEKYAAVAARAISRLGMSICVVGGPDETELAASLEAEIGRLAPDPPVRNLAGQTTLKQLAVVLRSSAMMLSNDSGPLHLAAELGTPSVGVFLCTDPIRSGPPGERHLMVSTGVSCRASYHKQCPLSGTQHMRCLSELDVERVWNAVRECRERELRRASAA
jgi:heptosyltransferase I